MASASPSGAQPRNTQYRTSQSAPGGGNDAPQASLAPHASAGADGVLAARLAKVRALAAPPADAVSWVRCEELQDELKSVLAGWRSWPEDGRCDESVRALALLLAAVDAAPVGLEVFLPLEDRDKWVTRLLGPALVPAGGRKQRLNHVMHAAMWGNEYVRSAHNNDRARVQPDDLLKWIGAAYQMSFPHKVEPGSHMEYEGITQSYVLFCRMGVAVEQPDNAAALTARLRQLGSPLTVEGLDHLIHQQKCFMACQMFKHPCERQHLALQGVAATSIVQHLLRLRHTSLRTAAITASTAAGLNKPADAIGFAESALMLAEVLGVHGEQGLAELSAALGEQGIGELLAGRGEQVLADIVAGRVEEGDEGEEEEGQGEGQGDDEPYHRALLHLIAARGIVEGGEGGGFFQVEQVQSHLDEAKAAKAACREWLPASLRAELKRARLAVPVSDDELAAAVQAGRATLPVQPPSPPVGALLAAGIPPAMQRPHWAAQGHQGGGECRCPVCVAKAGAKCAGCGNMVSDVKKCSQCRAVGYCSRECQKRHWREGHKEECRQLVARAQQRSARRT